MTDKRIGGYDLDEVWEAQAKGISALMKRLREQANGICPGGMLHPPGQERQARTCCEAADELERLTSLKEALMECYSITKEFEERCSRGQIRSRHTKARCEAANRVVEELLEKESD